MRVAPQVNLTAEQSTQMKAWARGQKTSARLVRRARIILLAAEGKRHKEIGALVGVMPRIVAVWRQRFLDLGLAGLEKDAPRSGLTERFEGAVDRASYDTGDPAQRHAVEHAEHG